MGIDKAGTAALQLRTICLSNIVRGIALVCLFAAGAATAKSPAPGALRVAWIGSYNAPSISHLRKLRHTLGKQATVRSIAATLELTATLDNMSVWPPVKALDPHVVILDFLPPADPGNVQANFQTVVKNLIALPSGPQVIMCTRTGEPGGAAFNEAVRKFAKSGFAPNIQVADFESASPDATLAMMVLTSTQRPEDGATIHHGSMRTLEEIDRIYAAMPPISYIAPADHLGRLPRTARVLKHGGTLRVVMLGDSIINDTSRSSWELVVERDDPKVHIVKTTSVRGSTGCQWYKEPGRVHRFVLDHAPDLVIIGRISQGETVDSIREVIQQIRSASRADIFLMTGPFGGVDPRQRASWETARANPYGTELQNLAEQSKTGFLDLQAVWGKYVVESGEEVTWFMRDPVHANAKGEQILGRILDRYFAPVAGEVP
jgi:lysophospholipase L1-like esterase